VSEEFPAQLSGLGPGSQVAGYRLEAQAGAGGMAVVFRARDERLGREVALKLLGPAVAMDPAFRRRFTAESRAAAAVDHPHIIPVYEAGEVGGLLFIAMRFVRGGDLRGVLGREGPLPPGRVAEFVSPVASALDAAHRAGLVHRDVKPGNILVDTHPDRPDHVYLSDFGVSKGAISSVSVTGPGYFIGTPDYSAPEQIKGLAVDGRADQYALACVAYQLLTGQVPFKRDQGLAVLYAHLSDPPPPLSAGLPDAVDQVLATAMAKAPEERYGSCRDFAEAFREALGLPPYHFRGPGLAPHRLPPPVAAQPEFGWSAAAPTHDSSRYRTGPISPVTSEEGIPAGRRVPDHRRNPQSSHGSSWTRRLAPVVTTTAAAAVAVVAAVLLTVHLVTAAHSKPGSGSTSGSTPGTSAPRLSAGRTTGPFPTGLASVDSQNSLFCRSSSLCMANSYYLASAGGAQIAAYNGSAWSVTYTDTAYRCSGCTGAVLSSIQCLSASLCHALDNQGDFLTYKGAKWTSDYVNSDLYWGSLSCPKASFCMAGDAYGHVWLFNGTSWSAPAVIDTHGPVPRGDQAFPDSLLAISCPTTSFCAAVDASGYVMTFDGTSWSAPQEVAPSILGDVSCPTTAFCVAVDATGDVVTYSGSAWTKQNIDTTSLQSVACSSSSFCLAGDSNGNIFSFNGSSWSSPTALDGGQAIRSISCPTAAFCAIGDAAGRVFYYKA
jgi:serine/threonine protein kinase